LINFGRWPHFGQRSFRLPVFTVTISLQCEQIPGSAGAASGIIPLPENMFSDW
jgi:hypothetical protein